MYNMQLKSPLQLFVNGKFVCNIDAASILYEAKEFKKLTNTSAGGTVINVEKAQPLTEAEKEEQKKESGDKDYDEFYHRMTKFPDVHEKIDW